MRIKYALLLIFLPIIALAVNPVTSEPHFATENDSIVIWFDATEGDAGLADYTGDIWAHTGVITENSTTASDWRYVVAGWSENTTKAKLTRIEVNLYKLVIGYPHEYYGCPVNEKILQLAFVFRNSTGSVTGRGDSGADVFLDLYESGITAVFIEPTVNLNYGEPERSPVFAGLGDTIKIQFTAAALGMDVDSLLVTDNAGFSAGAGNDSLSADYIITSADVSFLYGIAFSNGIPRDTASIYVVIPDVTEEVRAMGLADGLTENSATSITFSLFAPYKDHIYLIGDFNDWKVSKSYLMKKETVSEDSVYWWITLDGLNSQQEYGFQYLVDGEIRVTDPYVQKILDPWNDSWISDATYPDLKNYPSGKTEQAVGVFETGQPAFEWNDTEYVKPAVEKLNIYELLVREFVAKHDFKTLKDTLDYLQNMGINAVELMPVSEFEGNSSWGYNPSFYFAVDKYYGPEATLKELIDECHQRGIAVIMDMVLNHAYGQNPMARLYWNSTDNQPAANNPWFNEIAPHQPYAWGNDFNHLAQPTQYFVDRVNTFWLEEFHFDGFRFDFTKGFTNSTNPDSYDNNRINILKRMANSIWSVSPDAYVILEHWGNNDEEKVLANYGMMLWGNLTHEFQEAAMGYPSDFSWAYYSNRGWNDPHIITYLESHDEERMMFKNLSYGAHSGSYDASELTTALNRMKLTTLFHLMIPGPKMIWQFGEQGYDISIDNPCRVCEKPILWNYFQVEARQNLYKVYAAILGLRNNYNAFTSPSSLSMSLNSMIKRIQISNSEMNAVIMGNFNIMSVSVTPNFVHGGQWFDFFSGDTLTVSGSESYLYQPGEFHIYTDTKLVTPEPGITTDIENINSLPAKFALQSAFPNPFNHEMTLRYSLPENDFIRLSVFDVTGRKVAELFSGIQAGGEYQLHWNGTGNNGCELTSGIYFIRLQSTQNVQNKKIILLK